MNRELWLLRHAKATKDDSIEDFDRPLKKKGKKDALLLGLWLKQEHLTPNIIISSPAKRALNTAKIVCNAFDKANVQNIVKDEKLYLGGVGRIKTLLSNLQTPHHCVLLVGHNPDFEDLLIDLVGLDNLPQTDKLLPTACFVRIAMPDDWTLLNTKCGNLIHIIQAQSLTLDTVVKQKKLHQRKPSVT